MTSPDIPRGRYRGERVGKPVTDEAEHFIRCPACNGWIDCRDLACVFEHASGAGSTAMTRRMRQRPSLPPIYVSSHCQGFGFCPILV